MKRLIPIALTILLVLGIVVSADITDSDWPMPYHDLAHTSFMNTTSILPLEHLDLLFTFEAGGKISAPIAVDINNDDKAEILFGSSDNKLYVLNSSCEKLWTYEVGGAVSTPAVFDLLNNSELRILFGSSDNKLHALDVNGEEVWSYDTETNGSVDFPPVAVNLVNSPKLEVIFISTDENLYILTHGGKKIRESPLHTQVRSTPAVGDINSDGKLDILIGSVNNRLSVMDLSSLNRWSFQTSGDVSSPVVADINGYGNPEILVGSGDGYIYSLRYIEYQRGTVRKCDEFSGNCTMEPLMYSTLIKNWGYETSGGIVSPPAVADLDGDGGKEVIVGSKDKSLYIINNNGKVSKRYSTNAKILCAPAIADLDGDKDPEIIFGSRDGILYVLNSVGFRQWSYETGEIIDKQPAIADINRDRRLEILLAAGNRLYVFGYKSPYLSTTTTTTTINSTTTTTVATTTTVINSTILTTVSTVTVTIPTVSTTTTSTITSTTLKTETMGVDYLNFLLILSLGFLLFTLSFVAVDSVYTKLIPARKGEKEIDGEFDEIIRNVLGKKEEGRGLLAKKRRADREREKKTNREG